MNRKVKSALTSLLVLVMCISSFGIVSASNNKEQKRVKLGIDNIDNYLEVFKGKNVGLITNATGMNSSFESSIDVLYSKTNLKSLFAPEHGIRGNNQAGGTVGNEIDTKTGLPVYSLYGTIKKPTPEMLSNIDVLAYDIQDVGARFYTYIYTMAYAMQACAENNKTFVVFDRPNPVGGEKIEGNILNMDYSSFVGMYPIPQRYGLTVGEAAKLFNEEFGINCNLVVVPMTGWTRDMYYNETGLKTWVMPSPNMPTLDTAMVYTGTCLFEGTNVSEGRGTTRPFELIGAPYINSLELADKLNELKIPGAKFRPVSFTPSTSKYSSPAQKCGGVQLYVIDRDKFNPVRTGITMLYTIRDMYPKDFAYLSNNYIDKLTGDSYIREGNMSLKEIFKKLDGDEAKFKDISSKYYIYTEKNGKVKDKKEKVKLGIDNLNDHLDVFEGKAAGLITNATGMDSSFESSIDVLYGKINLKSLFAPEHGIRGNNQAGGTVENEIDTKTGLPVYSLYGSVKKPTPEMLSNIDILAYDIQDVGARFYTYIYTMTYAMQACAENNKTFVVFDRPNPVGGEKLEGNILNMDYSSFVGMYPILQRYGLTVGEIAKLFNKEFGINCKLVVIPMKGWTRDLYYDDTNLNTWVMPSPNMPTPDTAMVYTGTCVFEGTNLSEGRGTTRPFELIGAPYINSLELADKLNSLNIPGAKFRPASFTPTFSKHQGKLCGGVQLYVTDRDKFNPVRTGITMLYTIRDMYPKDFAYLSNNYIDKLTGDSYVRQGNLSLQEIFNKFSLDEENFYNLSREYIMYK